MHVHDIVVTLTLSLFLPPSISVSLLPLSFPPSLPFLPPVSPLPSSQTWFYDRTLPLFCTAPYFRDKSHFLATVVTCNLLRRLFSGGWKPLRPGMLILRDSNTHKNKQSTFTDGLWLYGPCNEFSAISLRQKMKLVFFLVPRYLFPSAQAWR